MSRPNVRIGVGVGLGALIVAAFVLSRLGWADASAWAEEIARSAHRAGPGGWALFALAQTAVAMAGIIPASLLGIAAGLVYGVTIGFALAAFGTLIGGWLAFRLARSLLRPFVVRLIRRRGETRLAGLDQAVGRDGWRFVCLLRISPVMPFAVTSYALGLTPISDRDYLLGTLAALPALLGYVAVGALARRGVLQAGTLASSGPLNWLVLGLGAVATVVLLLRSGVILARCGLLPRSIAGRPPA